MSLFSNEAEMTSSAERWLQKQGLYVAREYSAPWGLIDLVGVSFAKSSVALRRNLGQTKPVGPQERVAVLMSIPDERTDTTIAVSDLHSRFNMWMDKESLHSHVRALHERKFLQFINEGSVQKLNGWYPLHHDIVAVELKLNDVSGVIRQASANSQMCTRSYVGLPEDLCSRLRPDRILEMSTIGLGLLAVSPTNCEVVITPRRRPNPRNEILAAHCCERFWRRVV